MTVAPRFTVPRDDRRECSLYRIYVLDPRTNYTTVTLGYIGETGRQPFTRFIEHLYDQPWGDTIVGHPEVDPRVFASKGQVLAAEKATVLAERPLYNIEYQKGAPHQIPQWVAREQRAARDRAKGRRSPDWAAKGGAAGASPAVPGQRSPRRRAAAGQRPASKQTREYRLGTWKSLGVWAAAWPLASGLVWLALASIPAVADRVPWQVLPVAAAWVVSLGYVLVHVRRKRDRLLAVKVVSGVAVLVAALAASRGG